MSEDLEFYNHIPWGQSKAAHLKRDICTPSSSWESVCTILPESLKWTYPRILSGGNDLELEQIL